MTNNEREEYRLAALAAGQQIEAYSKNGLVWSSCSVGYWCPNHDSGQAFDLMLDANIIVYPRMHCSVLLADGNTFHTEPINGNPMLAIFRCAVAKGRSMENYK